MNKVKLLVCYYSQTGHNFTMANWAKDAAAAAGAEVRVRKAKELLDTSDPNPGWKQYLEDSKDVLEVTGDDLVWADAILFSVPTRFGNVPGQMKMFLDGQGGLWAQGKLNNKLVSAMATAQNNNGGQEMTIRAIYTTVSHWGAIIVPTGYTDDSIYKAGGNPYGTSGTATREGFANDIEEAVKHQAKRLVEVAAKFNS
ncbi:MAG TPA: NAD(P)H:quinone oxidoreductase, type IV [Clostridiaceae bacterium]|nr:NAD(P)H:quinone oxidoreductase, type IV [Clostridiaceae bacterium]